MPTLSEVAKRAGVSIATVSKVLSGTPYFTEETRQKVMVAVEELNYVPHLAARALTSGKTHIIALVFPYVHDKFSSDPVALQILEGVEAEINERGYNLLLSTPRLTENGPDMVYLQLLKSGYVDGLIALDNVPITSVLQSSHAFNIPAVSLGYGPNKYYVRSDDFGGGQQLMSYVLDLGHRDIGIISVDEALHYAIAERLAGFRVSLEKAGRNLETLPMTLGDFSVRSGATAAEELLGKFPNLTAIVCLNDRMAIGVIQTLHQRGIKVPQDISVVGYDDIPAASYFAPGLTTISQHASELGRVATRMLFTLLNRETPPAVRMATELIIRQSSAPPASV